MWLRMLFIRFYFPFFPLTRLRKMERKHGESVSLFSVSLHQKSIWNTFNICWWFLIHKLNLLKEASALYGIQSTWSWVSVIYLLKIMCFSIFFFCWNCVNTQLDSWLFHIILVKSTDTNDRTVNGNGNAFTFVGNKCELKKRSVYTFDFTGKRKLH